jgi:hypothetical protein
VQIIDDQKGAVAMLGELRTNPVDDRPLVEVGCRCQLPAFAGRAAGLPDGAEDGDPELLGVLLVALYLDDCQPIRLTWPIRPGRNSEVLPLPAGAEISVTLASAARSRDARSSPR